MSLPDNEPERQNFIENTLGEQLISIYNDQKELDLLTKRYINLYIPIMNDSSIEQQYAYIKIRVEDRDNFSLINNERDERLITENTILQLNNIFLNSLKKWEHTRDQYLIEYPNLWISLPLSFEENSSHLLDETDEHSSTKGCLCVIS